MNREKILKDLARSLKVEIGQKFRILTKPFENDIIRITNDTLEVNGEAFIYLFWHWLIVTVNVWLS